MTRLTTKHAEQHQHVNIKSLISISPLQKYTLYLKYSAYNCSASLATLKKKSYCIVANNENVPLITTRVQKHTRNVVRFESVDEKSGYLLWGRAPSLWAYWTATVPCNHCNRGPARFSSADKVNDGFKSDWKAGQQLPTEMFSRDSCRHARKKALRTRSRLRLFNTGHAAEWLRSTTAAATAAAEADSARQDVSCNVMRAGRTKDLGSEQPKVGMKRHCEGAAVQRWACKSARGSHDVVVCSLPLKGSRMDTFICGEDIVRLTVAWLIYSLFDGMFMKKKSLEMSQALSSSDVPLNAEDNGRCDVKTRKTHTCCVAKDWKNIQELCGKLQSAGCCCSTQILRRY